MSTKEISAAAQALGRRGGLKSLGAKSKAELSAFGKAAAQKRWAAFARGEQSGERSVGGMFSAGAQQLEALAGAVGLKGAAVNVEPNACTAGGFHGADVTPICRCSYADPVVEPTKPRRALPKAGSVNALVLAAMSIKPLTAEQIYERADGIPAGAFDRVRNALSSLRSGGHVVSEPHQTSAKVKLWRLA